MFWAAIGIVLATVAVGVVGLFFLSVMFPPDPEEYDDF